jgi:hypothetical protein
LGADYSGWQRIRILAPNEIVSSAASFALNCASTVTSVVAGVTPTSYTGACPKLFNFYATITANGPCTVTYKWERSDGAIAPTYSITFAAAGSQTVTTTWQIGIDYSGWQRVRILTPNPTLSNQASFSLNCL